MSADEKFSIFNHGHVGALSEASHQSCVPHATL